MTIAVISVYGRFHNNNNFLQKTKNHRPSYRRLYMYNEALCVASVQRAILVMMRVAIVVQQPTSDLHRSSSGEILFQIDYVLCLNIEISKLK
jgi:hypothetical protein